MGDALGSGEKVGDEGTLFQCTPEIESEERQEADEVSGRTGAAEAVAMGWRKKTM